MLVLYPILNPDILISSPPLILPLLGYIELIVGYLKENLLSLDMSILILMSVNLNKLFSLEFVSACSLFELP